MILNVVKISKESATSIFRVEVKMRTAVSCNIFLNIYQITQCHKPENHHLNYFPA
jgi:hypothetical protein